jgi:hypothetical protein
MAGIEEISQRDGMIRKHSRKRRLQLQRLPPPATQTQRPVTISAASHFQVPKMKENNKKKKTTMMMTMTKVRPTTVLPCLALLA